MSSRRKRAAPTPCRDADVIDLTEPTRKAAAREGAAHSRRTEQRGSAAAAAGSSSAGGQARGGRAAAADMSGSEAESSESERSGSESGSESESESESGRQRDGTFAIESIVSRRRDRETQGIEYKVHWRGYSKSEGTWEPAENLEGTADELVAKFEAEWAKKYGQQTESSESETGSDDDESFVPHRTILAQNDETPREIAEREGIDLQRFIAINVGLEQGKGLSADCRLKQDTLLTVPDHRPDQREWEFERIVDHQEEPRLLYEVKWKGSDELTWEPPSQFDDSDTKDYHRRRERPARRPQKRPRPADEATAEGRQARQTGKPLAARQELARAADARWLAGVLHMGKLYNRPRADGLRQTLYTSGLADKPETPDRAAFDLAFETGVNRHQAGLSLALLTRDKDDDEVVCVAVVSRSSQLAFYIHWVRTLESERSRGHCSRLVSILEKEGNGDVVVEVGARNRGAWASKGFRHKHEQRETLFPKTSWKSKRPQQPSTPAAKQQRVTPAAARSAAKPAAKPAARKPRKPSARQPAARQPAARPQKKQRTERQRPKAARKDQLFVAISCTGELPTSRFHKDKLTWRGSYRIETEQQNRIAKDADDMRQMFAKKKPELAKWRPLQLEVIVAAALARDDQNILVHMRTGSGKTLIYQTLASLNGCDEVTLVITPLTALKSEQFQRASDLGIDCMEMKGDEKEETQRKALSLRQNADCQLLFLTPEMMTKNKDVEKLLKHLKHTKRLKRAVIDEAHYVAACDDSFRPMYRQLGETIGNLDVPVLMLTATITPHVLTTLLEEFRLKATTDLFFRGEVENSLRDHIISVHPKRSV